MRRRIFWQDKYFVDVFDVNSDNTLKKEWTWHVEGERATVGKEHPEILSKDGAQSYMHTVTAGESAGVVKNTYADGDIELDAESFDAVIEREAIYAILSDKTISFREKLDKITREYAVSPAILDDGGWRELFSSLEYLDESHREDFAAFSLSARVESELEPCLERALAYFIYRHCTEAENIDDFTSSLGLCLVFERLLASIAERVGAKNAADLIIPARIISEELEYSEENTESIKFEFAFG
jgi:hypothetical protein